MQCGSYSWCILETNNLGPASLYGTCGRPQSVRAQGHLEDTYRRASEGHMVTVLLPGLVEALGELLEESMGLVENGKS